MANNNYNWQPNWVPFPGIDRGVSRELGDLRRYKTITKHNQEDNPHDKIAKVLNKTHVIWNKLGSDIMTELLTHDRAQCTHHCLQHPAADPRTDQITTLRKRARITIARVFVQSRMSHDIKVRALTSWIDDFLPAFDEEAFNLIERLSLQDRVDN